MGISWESSEPEERTAQAVTLISEAVEEINRHYRATEFIMSTPEWPGWETDAAQACIAARELLQMALPALVKRRLTP